MKLCGLMIPVGVCTEFVIWIVLGKFLDSLGKLAEELVCHAKRGDAQRYCFHILVIVRAEIM